MRHLVGAVHIPWLLNKKPFDVQQEAIQRAYNRRGWGHFLEQGLGKTSVTLAEYELYKRDGVVNCLVVVCPPTLMLNWRKEAVEFGVIDEVLVWDAKRRATLEREAVRLLAGKKPFVFVINYESVIASGGELLKKIVLARPTMLAVDESISVKDPQAKRSKELRLISPAAKIVRILSGAPVTQGVHDLWSQLRLLGALEKMNYFAFRAHFCQMGGWQGKQVVGQREDTAGQLTELLARWSWRAEKKDWTDLPEKLYTQRRVSLSGKQADAYEAMLKDFMLLMHGDAPVTADMVLTQMAKLQQITTGFVIDMDGNTHSLVEDDENPKLQAVHAMLGETNNKTLIFAYHKEAVAMLLRTLPPDRTATMIGGMLQRDFEEQKRRFNEIDDIDYGVCQINAAMYGHTLLGTRDKPCHTSIFFENVYSLNARIQSEDRNHRHGQKNAVLYGDIVASEMDELAVDALANKRNVADSVMNALKRKA